MPVSAPNLPVWQELVRHASDLAPRHLRTFFKNSRTPYAPFCLRHGEILLDFGKQRITAETLVLLRRLASDMDIPGWAARMAAGEILNHTEQRAVRHMDLRAGSNAPPEVQAVLAQMARFTHAIHDGTWRGFAGDTITDIVNLGIGGSDLGSRMAATALQSCRVDAVRVHFVSNVDGADLAMKLKGLNPRRTLFIVASKTFSTQETMCNAHTARAWLLAVAGEESAIARHFVATSSNVEAAESFGIAPENVFAFWDWVGGRFSLWSAIGLPIMLAVGVTRFHQLLAGAADMDAHFLQAPIAENLPITLALLSVWNSNFLHAASYAVFPYSQSLSRLPRYLQQLEMESCGKKVDRNAHTLGITTCPIVWGTPGTNGQHSYFQLLHQGGQLVACDFIALARADFPLPGHHQILLANCLAQSSALAFGQTPDEARRYGISEKLLPYRTFNGNQPSSTLLLPELTPFTLGQLIALYEHKVFCLGVLWHINAFDQWGVELGKHLAGELKPVFTGAPLPAHTDASTRLLLQQLMAQKVSV